MATKKDTTQAVEAEQAVNPIVESTYGIDDFVGIASDLGADKFVVRTALELTKKTAWTKAEAKKIVSEFINKEVR